MGILAIFLRPFGFIILFSLIINEFILNKKKKNAVYIIPLAFLAAIPIFLLDPNIPAQLYSKFLTIFDANNFMHLVKVAFNQINSLNVATLTIPLIVFINFFNKHVAFRPEGKGEHKR